MSKVKRAIEIIILIVILAVPLAQSDEMRVYIQNPTFICLSSFFGASAYSSPWTLKHRRILITCLLVLAGDTVLVF